MNVNVGLLGFGLAGRVLHAPLIQASGMRIGAVVTRQADAVKAALPRARIFATAEELFADPEIELVVITTPNALHAPQALAALAAGKHVVIDKPFALSSAEADSVIAAAAQHQRRLAVFHNRRWDSDFLLLQKLRNSGRMGAINAFQMRWDRYRPQVADRWREHDIPGGGMLWDLGPHLIDQALCLFGMPDWIQADVFRQRAGAVVDDAFEILMAKGQLRISLGHSSLAADNAFRYRLHGALASVTKCGLDVQETQLRAGMSPLKEGFGIEPPGQCARFVQADGKTEVIAAEPGNWLEFYRQMRASIERNTPVPVPAAEARNVIVLIEAALTSSRERRRVSLSP